ncbi:MAG: hypothetical protein QW463_08000 [Candidatus Caldarchaeum sp.]
MTAHVLNPEKGWPSPQALDFTAKISPNVLYDMTPGQCGHLNDAGEIEPGCRRWQMPLFLFQGKRSLDVDNSPANPGDWFPIQPSGRVMCLVGKGPFELWTTEFQESMTYLPNQPLRAPVGNAANDKKGGGGADSGILTNAGVVPIRDDTIAANATTKWTAVVGIVSKGVFTNAFGRKVLAFWPVWFPGHPNE